MRGLALRTVLVAALVALAGCNGLLGPTGSTANPVAETTGTENATRGTENATTGSATADSNGGWGTTTGAAGEALPPGLSADGVTDPWTLAEAHANALRNASYTVSSAETDWHANGSLAGQTAATTRFGSNGSASFSNRVNPGPAMATPDGVRRYDAWSNGTAAFSRSERANGSVEYARLPELPIYGDASGQDTLYGLYASYEFDVVDRFDRNGTTYYRLVSTDTKYGVGGSLSNASVTVLLDETGLVREYRVTGERSVESGTYHVDRTVRYIRVGDTTVERPGWIDEAAANATDAASR